MKFLQHNYWLVFFSCLLAGALLFFKLKVSRVNQGLYRWAEKPGVRYAFLVIFALFFGFFYLTRPVYYTPYWGGVTGDNFNYAQHGMYDPSYYTPQHLFHPYVMSQLIDQAKEWKMLDPRDPMLIEKAFTLYSLPNRVLALVGGFFAFLLLRKMRLSVVECAIGTFFLFLTFGYWFWAIQSNTIGFVIPYTIIALWGIITALEKEQGLYFLGAGLLGAVCVLIHISTGYMTIGMALAVAIVCGLRAVRRRSWMPLFHCLGFAAGALMMAVPFFYIASHHYHTKNILEIVVSLGDANLFGTFKLEGVFFKRFFLDSISTNLALVLGLIQNDHKTILEAMIIKLQLAFLLVLVVSLWSLPWKDFLSIEKHLALFVLVIVFLASIAGFSLRITWFQYYSAVTGVAVLLLLGLFFYPRSGALPPGNALFVSLLALCMFYTNAIGATNVFVGEKVTSHAIYRQLSALYAQEGPTPLTFYARTDTYPYNFGAILSYFKLSDKFSQMDWREPESIEVIAARVSKENTVAILNSADYPQLKWKQLPPLDFTQKKMDSRDYPDVYILRKRSRL